MGAAKSSKDPRRHRMKHTLACNKSTRALAGAKSNSTQIRYLVSFTLIIFFAEKHLRSSLSRAIGDLEKTTVADSFS